jgi:phosphatidylglycerophosphate synthase
MTTATPPLSEFLARRFAMRSPFWSWTLFEPAGGALAYLFARMHATPTVVTLLGGAVGTSGAALLGLATDRGDVLVSAALLLLAYTLDCADGQLARATGQTSESGAWLDATVDAVVIAFLSASLAYALSTDGGHPLSFLLAGAFGASRSTSLFTWARVKSTRSGAMPRTGVARALRTAYGSTVETPFVYAILCATRLSPTALRVVIVAVTVLTVGRTLVGARRLFRSASAAESGT